MSDDDFAKAKAGAAPYFYSAIATAALNKKDTATAIDNFKKELASVPEDQTKVPGPLLQDIYLLAMAYYQSTPPDLVNCTWYASRAAAFAPEPYKTQMMPLAKYCYKKYHGGDDGYDAVTAAAQANLNPPATSRSSLLRRRQTLWNSHCDHARSVDTGGQRQGVHSAEWQADDAAKVWDTIKGKSVQLPDVLVIASSATVVQVAVSDDAVQSKTADFTFNMKASGRGGSRPLLRPLLLRRKRLIRLLRLRSVNKVTLTGTYDSLYPEADHDHHERW